MKTYPIPIWRSVISFFLVILILVFTTGCNFYKVREVSPYELPSLQELGKVVKYFVLNQADGKYQLTDLRIDGDQLIAQLDELSKPVYFWKDRGAEKRKTYEAGEANMLNEVHVFLREGTPTYMPGSEVSIPLSAIEKIEVIDPAEQLRPGMMVVVGIDIRKTKK